MGLTSSNFLSAELHHSTGEDMRYFVTALLLTCLLSGCVDVASCQSDCPLISVSAAETVIAGILTTGENSQSPTVDVENFDILCLAQSTERNRYRGVSLLVEYTCTGNANCPTGIALEQIESECVNGVWSNSVLGVTDFTRTTHPHLAPQNATVANCAFCLSPDLAATFSLTSDILSHCTGKKLNLLIHVISVSYMRAMILMIMTCILVIMGAALPILVGTWSMVVLLGQLIITSVHRMPLIMQ